MSIYKGRCAGCGASWNSKAFKSKPSGCELPVAEERMLAFAAENETNNRACKKCMKKNRDLLTAKRAREEERERIDDVASKQLKPDCMIEPGAKGGDMERQEDEAAGQDAGQGAGQGAMRDADNVVVRDDGELDVESSEGEEMEGDVVLMLLSLAASNV